MKKVFLILLILVIVLSIAFPTFAHSGHTDSQGGHHDRNLPVTCRKKWLFPKLKQPQYIMYCRFYRQNELLDRIAIAQDTPE